ncbi:hypothetical protein NFI96_003699 [Prochilodus magdalenae]|nr:hypothetical protein NFI96_003699 [Prochilodus magdalenae]
MNPATHRTELNMEYNPSDHPRASTIFLSKSQTDVREKRKSLYVNHKSEVPSDYDKHDPEQKQIYRFVRTLFSAAQLTAECAIVTLVYLERLLTYAEIDICPANWKRIVLGAILLASKVWDDQAVWNVDYCQILKDITVEDMNELERQFLELLQFNINVPSSVYAKYYFDLRSLSEANNLSFPLEPLSREKAQKLEAISRLCDDKYKDLRKAAKKRSPLDRIASLQVTRDYQISKSPDSSPLVLSETSIRINISTKIVLQELRGMGFHGSAAACKPYITKHNTKRWMELYKHGAAGPWCSGNVFCGVMNHASLSGSLRNRTNRAQVSQQCLIPDVPLVGKIWLVLMVFLRVLVLFFAGYPLYQDEQDRFVCNTIQPGCANVCYDIYAPLSLFRFWLVQLTIICLPYIMFVVYVVHKVMSNLPADPEASERMKRESVYKIYQDPSDEASLSKSSMKSDIRQRRFTGAYIFHLLLRILLEAGFGAAHYYFFGFNIPKRFMCQQSPCTIMVDCYISRPTEKTIMLNFMQGTAALSLLLNVFDLICAIKRSVKKKSKKKMLVKKIYEEERYFVSGNGGANSGHPVTQDALARGSFRKRISKACTDDGASLQLDADLRLSTPREGTPLGINLAIPGSINKMNKISGYSIPQDEGMEREGSEVALCPTESLGTPRSIRVSKRSRLKPPPPPRRERPASAGALDITEATAVCTRRVGQYTLVEMSTGNDLPPGTGDGQEKKSEWV